jgi:hypothetical protein
MRKVSDPLCARFPEILPQIVYDVWNLKVIF